jgi:hypothetical protein
MMVSCLTFGTGVAVKVAVMGAYVVVVDGILASRRLRRNEIKM